MWTAAPAATLLEPLERDLHGQLEAARGAGAGVDRAGAAAEGAGYVSEVRVVRGAATGVRIGKLRGVGCIHGFQPELHGEPLAECDVLRQGSIQIEESRPDHGITSNVADLLGSAGGLVGGSRGAGRGGCRRLAGWRGKRGWIKPRAPT